MKRFFALLAAVLLALGVSSSSRAGPDQQPVIGIQFEPLTEYLKTVVNDPLLSGALIGARVDDVNLERTIFAHQPDLLVNPASVAKIITTAAALCLLHPDYRFKTEVYARRRPDNGIVAGPLYLKGYGDPFLVNERLSFLATELKNIGIQRINGPLVLDDSYFDSQGEGPGWNQDTSSHPYQAPMGAVSLNFNSVAVLLFPGEAVGKPARLELFPESDHFRLINRVVTVRNGTRFTVGVEGRGHRTQISVQGRVPIQHPGSRYYCRVAFPTWYTGHSFRRALIGAGVGIWQSIRLGMVPNDAELLYTLRSPALGELARKVNKHSQNFMAEQLMKTLGAEFIGVPGSWWKGQQVLGTFLEEEIGIRPGSYILHNGSGLNDVNRITASQVVSLLRYMWKRFDVRPDFLASLAVAGVDGTLLGRFDHPSLLRTMRLKTGSLETVRSLAGYVQSRGSHVFAFSVLIANYSCEGYKANWLIDRFASALARVDTNLQVVKEVEVNPVEAPVEETGLITPAGPPEGTEEAEIPVGEVPK